MSKTNKNQTVKLSNVVVLDEKTLTAIANGEKKFDNRKNNTGRPVDKKSARYKRLQKQAFYADVNNKFKSGKSFYVGLSEYRYTPGAGGLNGAIFNLNLGSQYVADVSYIGRTKVKAHTLVLGKRVNIELNLKTLEFVS